MGLARNAIATRVAARPELVWDVPNQWSLQDAVTVPLAYATAYYALLVRGRLQPGQRVLIHSGCMVSSLAAISICLHRGCEVRPPCPCPALRALLLLIASYTADCTRALVASFVK